MVLGKPSPQKPLAVGDYIAIGGAIYTKKKSNYREHNRGVVTVIHAKDLEQPYEVYVTDGPARGQCVRVRTENVEFISTSRLAVVMENSSPYRTSAKPDAVTELERRVSALDDLVIDALLTYKMLEAELSVRLEYETEYGRQHGLVTYADATEVELKAVRSFLTVIEGFDDILETGRTNGL
jgi:hypothetical protein